MNMTNTIIDIIDNHELTIDRTHERELLRDYNSQSKHNVQMFINVIIIDQQISNETTQQIVSKIMTIIFHEHDTQTNAINSIRQIAFDSMK